MIKVCLELWYTKEMGQLLLVSPKSHKIIRLPWDGRTTLVIPYEEVDY
jgi:hypothetical protein